ncbi:MAG: transcriptional regulator GcvA [Magnetovibrio sp.]|nr:transcriptional regulator GcvA [Magnetovibrio sp.]
MRRNLPTSTSLLCFESSARYLSFTRAAQELNLTQSAVSRQVRNLEIFLKIDLFHRRKKRLSLTAKGESYAKTVTQHLDRLEAQTLNLMSLEETDQTLYLGTFPTFGSRWLIPKLADFTAHHPDIRYNLVTSTLPFDFDRQDIDIAIQHGQGNWPDVESVKLVDEEVIAVCTPTFLDDIENCSPIDVLGHTLLKLNTRQYAWPEWLEAQGIQTRTTIHGPSFETFSMMIRAALSGLGIAILPQMYIADELRDGRLVSPFAPAMKSQRGYYLVFPSHKNDLNKVQKFRTWISRYTVNSTS